MSETLDPVSLDAPAGALAAAVTARKVSALELTDAAIAAIIADAEGRGAAAREPAPAARKRGLWSVLAR